MSRTIVVIHEFLATCDDQYTKLCDELTPQYWNDYLLVLDQQIVRDYCPDYAEATRRGYPRHIVMLIYGVMAGVMQTRNPKVFREYGKQLPFNASCLRNPLIGLEWVSLRLGIPAFRMVYDMAYIPSDIKLKLRSMFLRGQE